MGRMPGSNDITTFTYDSYNRLLTQTDSEGYTLTYSYDNANRPTQTLYPDGTTEQTIYDRLDAVFRKDRIGRWTQDSFDNMKRISYEIDPLGRKTQYTWCDCGSLSALTDPNGHVTSWNHDLQGRTIQKIYQDRTSHYGFMSQFWATAHEDRRPGSNNHLCLQQRQHCLQDRLS